MNIKQESLADHHHTNHGSSIDVPVDTSIISVLMVGAVVLAVAVLSLAVGLSWWQWLMAVALGGGLIASYRTKPRLCHLVSPKADGVWQCLVETYQGQQLWQGRLCGACDYGFCVVLDFEMDEPMPTLVRWAVFADSMDDEAYRRLKLLTAFMIR